MTSMYDDLAPSVQAMLARATLDRHDAGGRCEACTEAGCPEQVAASRIIAADRARRAQARTAPQRW